MKVYKTFKYKLAPTKEQVYMIEKTFRGCAYVYNYFLRKFTELRENDYQMSLYLCYFELKDLRQDKTWLMDLDVEALRNSIRRLYDAKNKYYKEKRVEWPYFKGKSNLVKSFTTRARAKMQNNEVHLPRIGNVRYKKYREVEGVIKEITVLKDNRDTYYVNFTCEVEVIPLMPVEKRIGIDMGIKDFLITSDGVEYDIPQNIRKSLEQLKREQNKLSQKQKGSSNYEKQRIKVCKIKEKIKYQRRDFQHKLSRKLVNENQVIISESLNIKGMLEVHYLTSSIRNSAWGLFINMLAYKAEWGGRTFQKVDRYFPSSQICSNCGHQNPLVKNLHIRMWTCPHCGTTHHRDINAAQNILKEGLRLIC